MIYAKMTMTSKTILRKKEKMTGDKMGKSFAPVMKKIGNDMIKHIERRFDTETTPSGKKWKGVKIPKYAPANRKILTRSQVERDADPYATGLNMRNSFVMKYNKNIVRVYNTKKYAKLMNDGGHVISGSKSYTIPPRKFMGANKTQRKQYIKWMQAIAKKVVTESVTGRKQNYNQMKLF